MMAFAEPSPQQLIEECQGLVRSLALGIHRKVPSNVELDDLISYGQIGLVEAARDFDASRGGRFSTYAYYRIRGAIYDGLSKMSWFGRGERSRLRTDQKANEVLAHEAAQAGERGDEDPVADLRWFRDVTRALAIVYLATQSDPDDEPLDATLVDPSADAAPSLVIRRETSERLHELIDALPPEAAALIRATYFEGMTLQEAGVKLGVSKSWASRLHAKALARLARSLRLQGLSALPS
jgi:RNA polymerase sigma factor for flagellar operon FliA